MGITEEKIEKLERSRRIHGTYFTEMDRLYRSAIPVGSTVLEVGCGTGRLIRALEPCRGVGIDSDPDMIAAARLLHMDAPEITFMADFIEAIEWGDIAPFDYIILSDVVPLLDDVQKVLEKLLKVCSPSTRIILNFHNNIWFPLLHLASMTGLRRKHIGENWLSRQDVDNLLYLSGYQPIRSETRVLLPFHVPWITPFFNRFLAKMPIIKHLCLACFVLARPAVCSQADLSEPGPSVSILIPTRNERGNIEAIFQRTPQMGRWTELVFVDGHSTDGTVEAIKIGIERYGGRWENCRLLAQTGTGKGQAVRQGFSVCRGDVLMILDSDLTMPPEDLPKYYEAIVSNKGEFINGCRLVYPMESRAMRFLNMLANKVFAVLFTWLLGQPVKDTLCGTKVLWKKDYDKIAANRAYFGDFDPFGDFDLLFGASRLNLKIVDLPIRYRDRTYGEIKISRWTHGMLLIRMCAVAFRKLKLN
ncbi:glycosyltransferase [bacterium]|nr:glycosyltransferase [candidate division CSSED10-310 bacterium]